MESRCGCSGPPQENLRFSCGADWRITLSAPCFRLVTYDQVRASPKTGRFRVLHPNIALTISVTISRAFPCLTLKYRRHSDGHYCDEQFDRASPSTTILFRRRSYAPLTQTCTAGVCARSCKSRREMRPRKLDETLSRHGRRARRVAFLSPRAMFGEYCSPLDYLYARFKLYQKRGKVYPAF